MTTLERVKELCKNKNISVKLLEEDLNFPNNTIYQWKNRTPGVDKLQKVADYFNVSLDYLTGRTDVKKINDEVDTIAAHIDDNVSEEELKDIYEYIELMKLKYGRK
ncbi:Phage transcriptional regulator, Cro/CI family [Brachybacterium faecium]|nr:Phage transcriptional regulator, Cro/CI family [Brachybacterium faecium]